MSRTMRALPVAGCQEHWRAVPQDTLPLGMAAQRVVPSGHSQGHP